MVGPSVKFSQFVARANAPAPSVHPKQTTNPKDPNTYQPTAQQYFGPKPWVMNPTGQVLTTGMQFSYNPYYFATPEAAQKVADYVGRGARVEAVIGVCQFGPFTQSHPNQMIQLPHTMDEDGNITKRGVRFNAGLFMSFFDQGYSQVYVDRLVKSELEG